MPSTCTHSFKALFFFPHFEVVELGSRPEPCTRAWALDLNGPRAWLCCTLAVCLRVSCFSSLNSSALWNNNIYSDGFGGHERIQAKYFGLSRLGASTR